MSQRQRWVSWFLTLAWVVVVLSGCPGTDQNNCDSCKPPDACVEGRCVGFCYDHGQCAEEACCVEGACVPTPAPIGDCPRCGRGEPIACTNLPDRSRGLVGIGACTLGYQDCVEGRLQPCVSGTNAAEVSDNGIDDDCDGTVDEGGPCFPNEERVCHRGFVGNAAAALALGECQSPIDGFPYGRQSCDANGTWGLCEGDHLPQRAPSTMLGFAEVSGQCDGLDNDCDGFYDESYEFDADGDGYTLCGSAFSPAEDDASENTHRLAGTDPFLEDCNDHDRAIHTVADMVERPLCRTLRAQTCRSAEGPIWDGIYKDDPFDDCGSLSCAGYFFGLVDSSADDGVSNAQCYQRANSADTQCNKSGECETAAERCPTSTRGAVVTRPRCTAPSAGCEGTTPPTFTAVAAGSDPYNDCTGTASCNGHGQCQAAVGEVCDSNGGCLNNQCVSGVCCGSASCALCQRCDVAASLGVCTNVAVATGECSAVSCSGYYYGLTDTTPSDGLQNPVCLYRANVASVACNGSGACRTAAELCPASGPGAVVPNRPLCRTPNGGCSGTTGPSYGLVPVGADPYEDCAGAQTCNGAGGCGQGAGAACLAGTECTSGNCVDGVCCGAPSCGTCQRCDVAGSMGVCSAWSGNNGVGCTQSCHACVMGVCTPQTGAEGNSCESAGSYCCAGLCVSAGYEYGEPCGAAGSCLGTWSCNGSEPRCSSSGKACDSCLPGFDTRKLATCNVSGACVALGESSCPPCSHCVELLGTSVCEPIIEYAQDLVSPYLCMGSLACGGGSCLAANGYVCSFDDDCASDNCLGSLCAEQF